MKIADFGVEQWMDKYETQATYNLGETCVSPFSLNELLATTGTDKKQFLTKLCQTRLTYGAITGSMDLKRQIAKLYQNLTPGEIVTEHGAIGANNLVLTTLVEPGDEVVAVTPTYQQLQSIPAALGATVKLLPLKKVNQFKPDPKELKAMVTDKTKLIVINNPDNPTGALMSAEELKQIVEIAKSVNAYVLCDEVYRHLNQAEGYTPSIIDLYPKSISTSSMSKVFSLAGLRLGWIATHDKELMAQILAHRDYSTISCSILDEMVATVALQNKDKIIKRNRQIVHDNLQILSHWVDSQPHISWVKPQAGTTALLYYDFDLPSSKFCKRLIDEYQTLLVPGSCFGIEHSCRIGYAFESENLKNGLRQVAKLIQELNNRSDWLLKARYRTKFSVIADPYLILPTQLV